MLLLIIRVVFAVVSAGAIAAFVSSENPAPPALVGAHPFASFVVLMLLTQSVTFVDILIPTKRIEVVSAIYFGLLIGFLLSYFSNQALSPLVSSGPYQGVVQTVTNLIFPYLCVTLLLQTKDKFRFIIPYIEFAKEVRGGRSYVLDTSSIIDGRIADVIETKIIDAPLIVPSFVLQELQDIADSNDKLRRNRGRRGLDVLSKLQANTHIEVKLYEVRQEEGKGMTVDQRLVELAKKLGGCVVTNDFNLNKVASVQGVDVINLNDLANSLKPRYLPGERMTIKIIKAGEGPGQGVGYLDDGTMVVIEDGGGTIGRETDIVVKSVLQSSAGRMIFGRLPTPADR
ncbi:MAG: PIN/TRAM domain-containing protein [Planctomycetaceae bacterium]|nr:PIN/TRAM domain-containing protein [Planctomycetaceae bacterium]